MKNEDNDHLIERIYAYYDDVVVTLRRRGLPMDDAVDIAKEVLIKADRKCMQLRDPDKLRGWIMKIANREATRQLKKLSEKWDREVSSYHDLESGAEIAIYEFLPSQENVEEQICAAEGEKMILNLLDNLNDREQTIFIRHNIEGYMLKEVAEELGVKETTVRSIHSRAIKKLSTMAEKIMREEGKYDK